MKVVYIDKIDDVVHTYNKTYRNTIKINLIDVKPSIYIDPNVEKNEEDPKFKVSDHVRISKFKRIISKCYISDWSGEFFVIKKVKDTVLRTFVISDFNYIQDRPSLGCSQMEEPLKGCPS